MLLCSQQFVPWVRREIPNCATASPSWRSMEVQPVDPVKKSFLVLSPLHCKASDKMGSYSTHNERFQEISFPGSTLFLLVSCIPYQAGCSSFSIITIAVAICLR